MKSTDTEKTKLSDPEIIKLYFDRDESAIEATDSKYGNYLFTIGYNILSDKWDSEECMNDTFFRTWNRIPPEKPNIFQAFLSKIMRDISIDCYRKKSADKRKASELAVSLEELGDCIICDSSVEEDYAIKTLAETLNTFLKNISKMERFIFICRYYYCDSVRHIANMLNTSTKTIYRKLEKIRNELRIKLTAEGVNI
jgi:RNA polymerase sigma-70 factor (ECF subfamily)